MFWPWQVSTPARAAHHRDNQEVSKMHAQDTRRPVTPAAAELPTFADLGAWAAWNARWLRESAHTLVAELVCDASEAVMARRHGAQ